MHSCGDFSFRCILHWKIPQVRLTRLTLLITRHSHQKSHKSATYVITESWNMTEPVPSFFFFLFFVGLSEAFLLGDLLDSSPSLTDVGGGVQSLLESLHRTSEWGCTKRVGTGWWSEGGGVSPKSGERVNGWWCKVEAGVLGRSRSV